MKTRVFSFLATALVALTLTSSVAFAARSGASFGGRSGFRVGGGGSSSFSRNNYSTGRGSYGGGSHFFFLPSFGWGGYGYGGGGSPFGTLVTLLVVGFGAVMVMRAFRAARSRGAWSGGDDADEMTEDRAYVYKVQLGLGRSAREIQSRLDRFAAEGDTSSETGLAQLLGQTALELMRHKDSIRYGLVDAAGPMSLTNGETKMNALSMAERSRFVVERVRGADGQVRRSQASTEESKDVLEYLVVTLVVATRTPLPALKSPEEPSDLQPLLAALGSIPPNGLLGLEVIWTPADPQDALTGDDLHTTYPEMRSL